MPNAEIIHRFIVNDSMIPSGEPPIKIIWLVCFVPLRALRRHEGMRRWVAANASMFAMFAIDDPSTADIIG